MRFASGSPRLDLLEESVDGLRVLGRILAQVVDVLALSQTQSVHVTARSPTSPSRPPRQQVQQRGRCRNRPRVRVWCRLRSHWCGNSCCSPCSSPRLAGPGKTTGNCPAPCAASLASGTQRTGGRTECPGCRRANRKHTNGALL